MDKSTTVETITERIRLKTEGGEATVEANRIGAGSETLRYDEDNRVVRNIALYERVFD